MSGSIALPFARPGCASSASSAASDDIVLEDEGGEGGAGGGSRAVVVDRQLARKLRPWQVDGVRFLYDCTCGKRVGHSGEPLSGGILAHAPGLGKSLQALTLIYTLLRRGPSGRAAIRKAAIVCPASLINNWVAEAKRWLPLRIEAHVLPTGAPAAAAAAIDFVRCPPQQLLVLSYEAARAHVDTLEKASIGLLICDEGHRLKASGGNRTIDALNRIGCQRRVILTGTPLQNDLGELWALIHFVAPGELGALPSFLRSIASPIDAGRQPGASEAEREAAEEATARLRLLSEPLIHRRDASVLASILPPRTEITIFCTLSEEARAAYVSTATRTSAGADGHQLAAITELRRICSHAEPHGGDGCEGSKLRLLLDLLRRVQPSGERVVVCSTFNASLDAIERAVSACGWGVARLDGSTPVDRRQSIVDRFNRGGVGSEAVGSAAPFVFLLATRAGGAGFNLAGASRLVLFDPDWNPAMDIQAMGRIYRQGQAQPVVIWRLLAAGTIEEKIYMRQLFKAELTAALSSEGQTSGRKAEIQGCADAAAEAGGGGDDAGADEIRQSFSTLELRKLFGSAAVGTCTTLHALLRDQPSREAAEADTWRHALSDPVLSSAIDGDGGVRQAVTYAADVGLLDQLRDERNERRAARRAAGCSDDEDEDEDEDAEAEAEEALEGAEEEMDSEDRAFIVSDGEEIEEAEEKVDESSAVGVGGKRSRRIVDSSDDDDD